MRIRRNAILALGLCVSALFGLGWTPGDKDAEREDENPDATIRLGAMRITSRILELRCEISNRTRQDLWIYAEDPDKYDANGARGTNARIFLDKDGQTLLILRRSKSPREWLPEVRVGIPYTRLPPGQTRTEVLSIHLPVALVTPPDHRLLEAIDQGRHEFTRLAFDIGYYTAEDLRSMADLKGHERVRPDPSGERVVLCDYPDMGIWRRERAVRLTVEGAGISVRRWFVRPRPSIRQLPWAITYGLNDILLEDMPIPSGHEYRYAKRFLGIDPNLLDGTGRQLADTYIQFAEGKLVRGELAQRLDRILSWEERNKLLDELYQKEALARAPQSPRPTPLQAWEDLFYSFSVDSEQYRYAQQLLAIDTGLLDGPARQIADVYTQVAEGKLNPAELAPRLDQILNASDRKRLLQDLREKQSSAPPKE